MNEVTRLNLQSWVDGELSGSRCGAMADLQASDPEARAWVEELRALKQHLRGSELPRALPLSGDFFWTRIQADLAGGGRSVAHDPPRAAWFERFYKLLVPAGAAVALAVLLVPLLNRPSPDAMAAFNIETSVPNSSVVAFHSEAEGITVVWLDSQ